MPAPVETATATLPERFAIPWNLSEWVAKDQILAWAQEEIGTLDWANPELAAVMRAQPSWQPRFYLVLLVYAYAMGVCDAEEAADLCYVDPGLKAAFRGAPPRPKSLTRFRIEHPGLIRWGLQQVFKRAVKARFDLGGGLIPPGVKRLLRDTAGARLDAARHLDRGQHDE